MSLVSMLPGKSCLARQILWGSTSVRQNTSGTSKWISLNREHTFHCTWVSRSPHVPGSWGPTTGTNVCTTLLMSSSPILGQKKSPVSSLHARCLRHVHQYFLFSLFYAMKQRPIAAKIFIHGYEQKAHHRTNLWPESEDFFWALHK